VRTYSAKNIWSEKKEGRAVYRKYYYEKFNNLYFSPVIITGNKSTNLEGQVA
jgi:hypothetical protein